LAGGRPRKSSTSSDNKARVGGQGKPARPRPRRKHSQHKKLTKELVCNKKMTKKREGGLRRWVRNAIRQSGALLKRRLKRVPYFKEILENYVAYQKRGRGDSNCWAPLEKRNGRGIGRNKRGGTNKRKIIGKG